MANINLHQASERSENLQRKQSFLASQTAISIILIVVASTTYFGLKFYQEILTKQKQIIIDARKAEAMNMDRDAVKSAIDFRTRVENITYNIEHKANPLTLLNQMESLLLSGVYLSSYEYVHETKTVELDIVADSFESVASQMWNFKKSGFFESVDVNTTEQDKDAKTVFHLVLVLK